MNENMYEKNFDKWNEVKKKIDNDDKSVFIRAGEIRWAILGSNVQKRILKRLGRISDNKLEGVKNKIKIFHAL